MYIHAHHLKENHYYSITFRKSRSLPADNLLNWYLIPFLYVAFFYVPDVLNILEKNMTKELIENIFNKKFLVIA